MKLDLTRILLDHETIPEDPTSDAYTSHYRYQLINSSFNVPAKLNHRASSWKWCCRCCNPYEVAAAIEFTKIVYEPLDIFMDGRVAFESEPSCFVMSMQGQHGGNGCLLSPLSVVNDGLSELMVVQGRPGPSGMLSFMNATTKGGGVHGYDPNILYMRGESFKVVPKRQTDVPHIFAIDGEPLYFNKFIKYESIPEAIEVLVDYEILMES